MTAPDDNVDGGAVIAADLIMGQAPPNMGLTQQVALVLDSLALGAHQHISAVDQHWQIAIHLWPALKTIARHTDLLSGHLLAAGIDADMLAGRGPHPDYPRDPRRHLVFHTPIPPPSRWPHDDLPLHETGTDHDPGKYNLVLVNLPYHDVDLLDPDRRARLGAYHQELLTSAVSQATPGGIVVALASAVFLDHPDPDLRQQVTDQADLVGAARLPGGAMRPDSHAIGPTDVLILRARHPERDGPGIPTPREVTTESGRAHLSTYWLDNPSHVLGNLRYDPDTETFTVDPGRQPIGRSLQIAFDQIATIVIASVHAGAHSTRTSLPAAHRTPESPGPTAVPGP